VNVISQRPNSGWKELGVRLNIACGVALTLPAIVDHDVLVSSFTHTGCHYVVRGCLDEVFVDVTSEPVPGVSSHRRRAGK
jgi:hypothetical protein